MAVGFTARRGIPINEPRADVARAVGDSLQYGEQGSRVSPFLPDRNVSLLEDSLTEAQEVGEEMGATFA